MYRTLTGLAQASQGRFLEHSRPNRSVFVHQTSRDGDGAVVGPGAPLSRSSAKWAASKWAASHLLPTHLALRAKMGHPAGE